MRASGQCRVHDPAFGQRKGHWGAFGKALTGKEQGPWFSAFTIQCCGKKQRTCNSFIPQAGLYRNRNRSPRFFDERRYLPGYCLILSYFIKTENHFLLPCVFVDHRSTEEDFYYRIVDLSFGFPWLKELMTSFSECQKVEIFQKKSNYF